MDNDAKLRPLYLARILYEHTDEGHFLTTSQLISLLEEQYGIKAHRHTIKAEIQLLRQFGFEIEEVKSTQNRYNLIGRAFDLPELKLLIDAVASSKFITQSKSKQLVEKIGSLASCHAVDTIKRNVTCEGESSPTTRKCTISLTQSIKPSMRTKRFPSNISNTM